MSAGAPSGVAPRLPPTRVSGDTHGRKSRVGGKEHPAVIDAAGELLALGLFLGVCAALMLGFPVAFTLAGTSLLFAGLGHLLGHFDLVLFLSLAPATSA
jgi:hypothetical protein